MISVSNSYVIPLSWRNLLLVLGGGIALWVLPWLAWPLGKVASARDATRKPPVFRYVKGANGLDGSTWSPVLMPLPTSDGFSKKAAVKAMTSKSPVSVLKPQVTPSLYLEMKDPVIPALVVPGMGSLKRAELDPGGEDAQVVVPVPATRTEGLQVELTGELKVRQFTIPMLQSIPVNAGEATTLMLTAHVELDPRGFVKHLFLEQPSGVAALDAAVVRSLWSGSGIKGDGLATGRVKLYYWKSGRLEKE